MNYQSMWKQATLSGEPLRQRTGGDDKGPVEAPFKIRDALAARRSSTSIARGAVGTAAIPEKASVIAGADPEFSQVRMNYEVEPSEIIGATTGSMNRRG